MNRAADDDFVMVDYTHPNRGGHAVIGAITKTHYGYRSGGERFLVHRSDAAAHPQYFRPVVTGVVREAPRSPIESPPPPPVIKVEEERPDVVAVISKLFDELDESLKESPADAKWVVAPLDVQLDLQLLPGVTPSVERSLRQAHLDTVEAILTAGEEGLMAVKFIGAAKAHAIYDYVVKRYGSTTPA